MLLQVFTFLFEIGIEQKGLPLELNLDARRGRGLFEVAKPNETEGSDNVRDNLDVDNLVKRSHAERIARNDVQYDQDGAE